MLSIRIVHGYPLKYAIIELIGGASVVDNSLLTYAIERDPTKVSGEWIFKGTRVPLAALFENLKDGASVDEFLEWFPGVKREQILAVFDHELASLSELATV